MLIKLILTGGTIGSIPGDDGLVAPNTEQMKGIVDRWQAAYPKEAGEVTFDVSIPFQILSEELDGAKLTQLLYEIEGVLRSSKNYDAIMICHGTDTLPYTAAMLSILFSWAKIPMVVVSGNYPLDDPRSNGLVNFAYGIRYLQMQPKGVSAVYRNTDGKTYVHAGQRLLVQPACDGDLFSIGQRVLGYFDEEGTWVPREEDAAEQSRDFETLRSLGMLPTEEDPIHPISKYANHICMIRCFPGKEYPDLDQSRNGIEMKDMIQAILIETYHSGTVCDQTAFCRFVRQAQGYGIPVYAVGTLSHGTPYATTGVYEELGLKLLPDCSPVAAYCGLWYLTGK